MKLSPLLQTVGTSIILCTAIIALASLVPAAYAADDHPTVRADGTREGGGGEGSGGGGTKDGGGGQKNPDVAGYLTQVYRWFLGFIGIAALFALVTGGVLWMASGTSVTDVGRAKRWISNAIWGIVLAAASFLLLKTINPELVGGFDINAVIDRAVRAKLQKPSPDTITPGPNVIPRKPDPGGVNTSVGN